jgi:hypothetical protein
MTVSVVYPQKASLTIPVPPGQTEAYTDAPIYAQTSGYLQKWYFMVFSLLSKITVSRAG